MRDLLNLNSIGIHILTLYFLKCHRVHLLVIYLYISIRNVLLEITTFKQFHNFLLLSPCLSSRPAVALVLHFHQSPRFLSIISISSFVTSYPRIFALQSMSFVDVRSYSISFSFKIAVNPGSHCISLCMPKPASFPFLFIFWPRFICSCLPQLLKNKSLFYLQYYSL